MNISRRTSPTSFSRFSRRLWPLVLPVLVALLVLAALLAAGIVMQASKSSAVRMQCLEAGSPQDGAAATNSQLVTSRKQWFLFGDPVCEWSSPGTQRIP